MGQNNTIVLAQLYVIHYATLNLTNEGLLCYHTTRILAGSKILLFHPLPQATRRSCMPPGPTRHWFNTRPEQGTCTRCKDLRPTWNRGVEIWSPHSWCPSHFHVIKSRWPGTCPAEKPHHYNTIKTHDWTQTITRPKPAKLKRNSTAATGLKDKCQCPCNLGC